MDDLRTTLTCECGEAFEVGATDAGDLLACSCGRSVTVPTLSKLRSLAGKDAYVTNPAEAIRKIQRDGRCPAGDRCVVCGSASPVIYRCHALCEAPRLKHSRGREAYDILGQIARAAKFIVLGPFFWLLAQLAFTRRHGQVGPEIVGHEVQVSFDLPICSACASTNGDVTRPAVAKRLMARVPFYRELLAYYPQLTLKVDEPHRSASP